MHAPTETISSSPRCRPPEPDRSASWPTAHPPYGRSPSARRACCQGSRGLPLFPRGARSCRWARRPPACASRDGSTCLGEGGSLGAVASTCMQGRSSGAINMTDRLARLAAHVQRAGEHEQPRPPPSVHAADADALANAGAAAAAAAAAAAFRSCGPNGRGKGNIVAEGPLLLSSAARTSAACRGRSCQ